MTNLLKRLSPFVLLIYLFAPAGAGAATARGTNVAEGGSLGVAQPAEASRELTAISPTSPGEAIADDPSGATAPLGQTALKPNKNASTGLSLVGAFTFSTGPSGARMTIDHITNTRSSGVSGSLRLELWATTTVPVFGNTISHFTLGTFNLSPLTAGFQYNNVDTGFVAFTPPPAGCYYITLALLEFESSGYFYVDLRTADQGGVPDGSGFDLFSYGGANCSRTSTCVRDASTACLLNGRFQVNVTYRTSSTSGNAKVMSFAASRAESDESAFFWFFAPTNFEMGLKVLNACSVNNRFWVYVSGLTDQGWTVNILDTQTGATVTYANSVGHLSSTVADTGTLRCP